MEIVMFLVITILVFSIPLIVLQFGKEWLIALIPIYLITGNVFAESFVFIFGSIQSLAIPIYAATFLITDTLSEHFGRQTAKRAVLIGFMGQFLFVSFMLIITHSPVIADKLSIYNQAFSVLPRLILGSFVAYLISQIWDVFIYHLLKEKYKSLFVRNNLSTITSQLLDTTIFISIAFYGRAPFDTIEKLVVFILTTWLFKIAVAFIDYPFIHWSVKYYKKRDNG